jgi:hypothetical protein
LKWARPAWTRWRTRDRVTLEEFVALSLDVEPSVPLATSWGGENGETRLQELQAAIAAGEIRPGAPGAEGQGKCWPMRVLAQWAARACWPVPQPLAELGVFTTLELADLLADPGPMAGNPWAFASVDDTMQLIEAAALAGALTVRHPVHLLPVDAREWPQPSSGQLVVRWSDVERWRGGGGAGLVAALPQQQPQDAREGAPALGPGTADRADAASDAPAPQIPAKGEREGIGAYRARLVAWAVDTAGTTRSVQKKDIGAYLEGLRPDLFVPESRLFGHAWDAYKESLKA